MFLEATRTLTVTTSVSCRQHLDANLIVFCFVKCICVVYMACVYPKLRNINPHNATHSLISCNPTEHMFVVQSSLLIVTFHSLISRNSSLMQTTKEVNPHPHIAPCVNMWSVTFLVLFFFFFSLCHLLNVGACLCHIARKGQVEWTTLAY